jgi:hypothetical protein
MILALNRDKYLKTQGVRPRFQYSATLHPPTFSDNRFAFAFRGFTPGVGMRATGHVPPNPGPARVRQSFDCDALEAMSVQVWFGCSRIAKDDRWRQLFPGIIGPSKAAQLLDVVDPAAGR